MKLLACLDKEIRIIRRDYTGLMILIIMPIALAIIVTLVQEEAFSDSQRNITRVLLVDNDGGYQASKLIARLNHSEEINIIQEINGTRMTEEAMLAAIRRGEYQVGILIAEDSFNTVRLGAANFLANRNLQHYKKPMIKIYFDFSVRDIFRRSIKNAIARVLEVTETEIVFHMFLHGMNADEESLSADFRDIWKPGDLVGLESAVSDTTKDSALPNVTQQNVPAWTLFAMFLVVIPLSGSVIKEQDCGVITRLRCLPPSYGAIIIAKLIAYVLLCLLQLIILSFLGIFAFPMIGLPAFEIGTNYFGILLVALFCSLAATGFGLLIATLARTHEQASVFGATSVVIMAALGGVMVPEYLMPPVMRSVTSLSPLNWGLSAFLKVFLRDASLMELTGDILKLSGFSFATIIIAILKFGSRE